MILGHSVSRALTFCWHEFLARVTLIFFEHYSVNETIQMLKYNVNINIYNSYNFHATQMILVHVILVSLQHIIIGLVTSTQSTACSAAF
jgi:hypothetical protein